MRRRRRRATAPRIGSRCLRSRDDPTMAAPRPPAFLFYARDWMAGTLTMTPEEKGVYITLLAYAWDNEGLPNSIEKLAKINSISFRKMTKFWGKLQRKFQLDAEGRWRNLKLERVRQESAEFL